MHLPRAGAHFIARHRRAAWNRGIAKVCRTYLNAFDNLDYDGRTNGELALVDRLLVPEDATVLDVGANVGEWTAAFRQRHPTARVHAFEIDPVTAQSLQRRFAADDLVTVVPTGLSDGARTATLKRHARSSTATSLIDADEMNADATTLEVDVGTGDEHLDRARIDCVTFLKVDTEGNDLNVLRGFTRSLAAGRVLALQFEHNEWAVPAGVHLRDFYDLLTPLGFEIGRLFPDCVLLRPWRPAYEREAAGNHVAVRRDQPALRERIAGSAAR